MRKIINPFIQILILFPIVCFGSDKGENNKLEDCAISFEEMQKNFYIILSDMDSKENPVDKSLEYLEKQKEKKCKLTITEKAGVVDLYGEAARVAYVITKDNKFFDQAKGLYEIGTSLETSRNELIWWHLSLLYRSAGRYEEAINWLNKVLQMDPQPSNPMPYLKTAFQLSVDMKQWDNAMGLLNELGKRDKKFYADVELLYSSILTLCHFKGFHEAHNFINNVEKYIELDEKGKKRLKESKDYLENCEKQSGIKV